MTRRVENGELAQAPAMTIVGNNTGAKANKRNLTVAEVVSMGIGGGGGVTLPINESDVTNLVTDLAAKAPLASPAFTSNPTAPTQSAGNNSTRLATTAYADAAATVAAAAVVAARGMYGDGSDGSLTIGSGVTHTMTFNEFRTSVTVQNGGVLDCAGWIMTGNGTLTVDSGGVVRPGTPAAGSNGNASNGAGGTAESTSGRYLGVNGAGGVGGIANGGSVTLAQCLRNVAGTPDASKGGAGGAGAAGGLQAGGAGGTRTVTETNGSGPRCQPWTAMGMFVGGNNDTDKVNGGSGGGGGGGHASTAASGSGGGGGAGGLVLCLAFPAIVNNGTISAPGAAGGNGTGTDGGGGGGGGGGLVLITTESYTGTAPTAAGGTGGTKTGAGVVGADGNAGVVIILRA